MDVLVYAWLATREYISVVCLWTVETIVWKDGGIQFPWFYIDEHVSADPNLFRRPSRNDIF